MSFIQVWRLIRIKHSRALYLSIVTHTNQTKSMFDWQFSDLHYIKIKLTLTAYKLLCRCHTYKCEIVRIVHSRAIYLNITTHPYIQLWGIVRIIHSRAIYLSITTHPNQTKSMFNQQFSDLHYIIIKLILTAYKSLFRCCTYKFEVCQGLFI